MNLKRKRQFSPESRKVASSSSVTSTEAHHPENSHIHQYADNRDPSIPVRVTRTRIPMHITRRTVAMDETSRPSSTEIVQQHPSSKHPASINRPTTGNSYHSAHTEHLSTQSDLLTAPTNRVSADETSSIWDEEICPESQIDTMISPKGVISGNGIISDQGELVKPVHHTNATRIPTPSSSSSIESWEKQEHHKARRNSILNEFTTPWRPLSSHDREVVCEVSEQKREEEIARKKDVFRRGGRVQGASSFAVMDSSSGKPNSSTMSSLQPGASSSSVMISSPTSHTRSSPSLTASSSTQIPHSKSTSTLLKRRSPRLIQTQRTLVTESSEMCFLIESTEEKHHFWCVHHSPILHMNQVVLRKSFYDMARHDPKYLWFRREGDPHIYSMMKKNGEHLVLDYHESTYSMGLSKSMVVRRKNPHRKTQQYDLIPWGMSSSRGTYVRIQNKSSKHKRFVKKRHINFGGGEGQLRLKKAPSSRSTAGEWRVLPANINQTRNSGGSTASTVSIIDGIPTVTRTTTPSHLSQKPVEETPTQKIVKLPIDGDTRKWFMDINTGVSPSELDKRWNVRGMMEHRDEFGNTAVMRAVLRGHFTLLNHLLSLCTQLEQRKEINLKNDYEQTALHLAAYNGKLTFVHALVEGGAVLGAQDRHGSTPLMDAVEGNHLVVMDYLIQKNPQLVYDLNHSHQNIVHACVLNHSTQALHHLLQVGVITREMLHQKDEVGCTPMHYAAADAYLEGLNLLLEHGGDPNVRNDDKDTCLHLAAVNSHYSALAVIRFFSRVQVDESLANVDGITAKDIAKKKGIEYPNPNRESLRQKKTTLVVRRPRGTSSKAAAAAALNMAALEDSVKLGMVNLPLHIVASSLRVSNSINHYALQVDMRAETNGQSRKFRPKYPVGMFPADPHCSEQRWIMNGRGNIVSLGVRAVLSYEISYTNGTSKVRLVAVHPDSVKRIPQWKYSNGKLICEDSKGRYAVTIEKQQQESVSHASTDNGEISRDNAALGAQSRRVSEVSESVQQSVKEVFFPVSLRQLHQDGEEKINPEQHLTLELIR